MKIHRHLKQKLPTSLKRRLVRLILLCWAVPVVVIFAFLMLSYRKSIITKLESLLMEDMRNRAVVTGVKLDEAITAAKKVSYDQTLEEAWRRFGSGDSLLRAELYKDVTGELKSQFYTDRRFDMFAFYLTGETLPLSYSSKNGHSYRDFINEDAPELMDIFEKDTPDAFVCVVGQRLYIVRNLYTVVDYTRYGSLVTELNLDELWKEEDSELSYDLFYCVGDPEKNLTAFRKESNVAANRLAEQLFAAYSGWETDVYRRAEKENYLGYLYEYRCRDYHLGVVLISDKRELFGELLKLYQLIALLLSILLPVILFAVYFVNRHVSHPIMLLTQFAKKLEQGGIGITMQEDMPNQEFAYLRDTYNHMSKEVKELFDYAYDEQLARKDAKIQALQAQINPHFLNNTLEMMNWQARMAGDSTISKMIEALSTVLDYSMDREDRRLIPLAEELRCADAYYYIISMRFGQRVQIEKEIDRSLLQIPVPQLILQPLLENAVVHGVEAVKNAVIKLRIYHDETCVFLQIQNTGRPLTQEDRERIEHLLSGRPAGVQQGKGKHTSLGIRNINERIKLIYGEEYGLSILSDADGVTVSTIRLPR